MDSIASKQAVEGQQNVRRLRCVTLLTNDTGVDSSSSPSSRILLSRENVFSRSIASSAMVTSSRYSNSIGVIELQGRAGPQKSPWELGDRRHFGSAPMATGSTPRHVWHIRGKLPRWGGENVDPELFRMHVTGYSGNNGLDPLAERFRRREIRDTNQMLCEGNGGTHSEAK